MVEPLHIPNSTQVPDRLFDELLPDLSLGELRVLLYIIRRTFGFQRREDKVSLTQLTRGITRKNGKVLDRGTGLHRETVTAALRSLEDKGLIASNRRESRKNGNLSSNYRLCLDSEHPEDPTRVYGNSDMNCDAHLSADPTRASRIKRRSYAGRSDPQGTDHKKQINKVQGSSGSSSEYRSANNAEAAAEEIPVLARNL